MKCISIPSTPAISSQTVQAAVALGIVTQTENQTEGPYTEMHRLLNIAATNTPPTYADIPELPTMQAKTNTDPEVRDFRLTPMELNVITSRETVSAAPVRRSDNAGRNIEVGAAFELGEWWTRHSQPLRRTVCLHGWNLLNCLTQTKSCGIKQKQLLGNKIWG